MQASDTPGAPATGAPPAPPVTARAVLADDERLMRD
ncbi:MAG: hypothetical protein RLZZ584_1529, partial [Pseudomonadota bacterium]